MTCEGSAEDERRKSGRRIACGEHTDRDHEQLLGYPVAHQADEGWKGECEENRVRLEPRDEIGKVRHDDIEYTRTGPTPGATEIT